MAGSVSWVAEDCTDLGGNQNAGWADIACEYTVKKVSVPTGMFG